MFIQSKDIKKRGRERESIENRYSLIFPRYLSKIRETENLFNIPSYVSLDWSVILLISFLDYIKKYIKLIFLTLSS